MHLIMYTVYVIYAYIYIYIVVYYIYMYVRNIYPSYLICVYIYIHIYIYVHGQPPAFCSISALVDSQPIANLCPALVWEAVLVWAVSPRGVTHCHGVKFGGIKWDVYLDPRSTSKHAVLPHNVV